jgi:hypothetical protein
MVNRKEDYRLIPLSMAIQRPQPADCLSPEFPLFSCSK